MSGRLEPGNYHYIYIYRGGGGGAEWPASSGSSTTCAQFCNLRTKCYFAYLGTTTCDIDDPFFVKCYDSDAGETPNGLKVSDDGIDLSLNIYQIAINDSASCMRMWTGFHSSELRFLKFHNPF